MVNVTLLYFDDCPNWVETDRHLRALAAEYPEMVLQRRLVETAVEAEEIGFHGSPSVVVDGVDLFVDADALVGLSCRMYRTPSGLAGSPTRAQLREAIFGA